MRPGDGGANFGWRMFEGTVIFNGTPVPGMVPPVAEYLHGAGPREGNSVTGGYVYRGPVESLRGQYIFGDFVLGNLWSIPIARVSARHDDPEQPVHPAPRRFHAQSRHDRQCRELRRRPGRQPLHRRFRRRHLPDRTGVTPAASSDEFRRQPVTRTGPPRGQDHIQSESPCKVVPDMFGYINGPAISPGPRQWRPRERAGRGRPAKGHNDKFPPRPGTFGPFGRRPGSRPA